MIWQYFSAVCELWNITHAISWNSISRALWIMVFMGLGPHLSVLLAVSVFPVRSVEHVMWIPFVDGIIVWRNTFIWLAREVKETSEWNPNRKIHWTPSDRNRQWRPLQDLYHDSYPVWASFISELYFLVTRIQKFFIGDPWDISDFCNGRSLVRRF